MNITDGGIRVIVLAALLVLVGCSPEARTEVDPDALSLRELALSLGLEVLAVDPPRPAENPLNQQRIDLGHLLFFDPILSGPQDVACGTCHLPSFGFADGRQFGVGAGGKGLGPERTLPEPPLRQMPRNSPTVFNAGVYGRGGPSPTVNGMMFWGGTAFGLEDQVLNPLTADKEMRGLNYGKVIALDSVMARLRGMPEYVDLFSRAYPDIVAVHGNDPLRLITARTLRRSLASYVRELVTPNSPFDHFLRGDESALSAEQQAGLALFSREAGCIECHKGPLLSDFSQHVLGTEQQGMGRDTTPGDDVGWGEAGGVAYAFRTPPLRQVELTAPYFHAGTAETLEDVVRFKNRGVSENPRVDTRELDPLVHPLGLSDREVAQLVAFLHSLTDLDSVQDSLFLAPERVPSGLTIPR